MSIVNCIHLLCSIFFNWPRTGSLTRSHGQNLRSIAGQAEPIEQFFLKNPTTGSLLLQQLIGTFQANPPSYTDLDSGDYQGLVLQTLCSNMAQQGWTTLYLDSGDDQGLVL